MKLSFRIDRPSLGAGIILNRMVCTLKLSLPGIKNRSVQAKPTRTT